MKLLSVDDRFIAVAVGSRPAFTQFFLFLARFTLFIAFLFFPDNFEVIKSVYFLQNVKKT
jgi:hypothetical protein